LIGSSGGGTGDPVKGRVEVRNVRVGGDLQVQASVSAVVSGVHANGDIRVVVSGQDVQVSVSSPTESRVAVPAAASRRIWRDPKSGMLGGVCEGFADRLQVDPLWLRLAFIAAAMLSLLGVAIYGLCWVLMPKRQEPVPALPAADLSEELREAWREVEEITKN
jgi:phage shock protein PspC (stress-responsive transcriptional regulator)